MFIPGYIVVIVLISLFAILSIENIFGIWILNKLSKENNELKIKLWKLTKEQNNHV